MAKEMLRKIRPNKLIKILKEHELWLESDRKEGKCANLEKVDLVGANLEDANLKEANLSGANLEDANFKRANLSGANLEGVNIQYTFLTRANFKEANFSGADLAGVFLEGANLSGANFVKADLSSAKLQGANLMKANLSKADLKEARLSGANLKGANFEETNLSGADLKEAILDGNNLKKAKLNNANLWKANLHKANLQQANMMKANLQEVNLSEANLQYSNLNESVLIKADLSEANMKNVKLSGANLEKAVLKGTNLKNSQLTRANFKQADVTNSDLGKAKCSFAKFILTNLGNSNLKGADLSGANLFGANLKSAKLHRAKLIEATLTGANLEYAEFKDTDLTNIKINKKNADQLPKSIIKQYGRSFYITGIMPPVEKIIRSIEFPPEYQKAGISILHTFGEVLRKKYPDKQAKVRIEQEDLKVTMIIETVEGDREIIEETLNDYGLVVTGKILPEQFTDDPNLILEIKNELNYAKARIESQRDLIQYQQANIENLNNFLTQFIQRPSQPIEVNIPVSSSIDASIRQNINVEISPQINLIHGSLNELKEQLPQGSAEVKSVDELQQSLDQIERNKSKEEVAKSSAMSKLGRFLENVQKAETTAGKIIKTTKDGIDIARKLAGHYNQIAQWCGLPQVPEPFVKK